MKGFFGVAAGVVLVLSLGCEVGPDSGAGLRLPNGDVAAGEKAFRDLGCRECHSIAGGASPVTEPKGNVIVALGGLVPHIETHGELVTSIVNPSHGFPPRYERGDVTDEGESIMTNYNERMTVKQLIDLTEYLQSKYELELGGLYAP